MVLDRVATLVGAGVGAPRAWWIVLDRERSTCPAGDAPPSGSAAQELRLLAAHDRVWRDVAAVVSVAERTGAPAAPALRSLASAVRHAAESERAARVALAGPRSSTRVVLALPLFGLLLGSAWGAGAVSVLVATPLGWTCVALAAGLVAIARWWSGRLVSAATPPVRVPGALIEAWAVAVSGGGAWSDAAAVIDAEWPRTDDQREVAERAVEHRAVRDTLALAESVGVPAAALLRAAAEDVRRDVAADGLAAAERLGVRLVLPLGVCVLPAFVLVGVVPVIVGVLTTTTGVLG